MIPALGFMPDVDPTTPGVFLDCENIIPSTRGFAAAKSSSPSGLPIIAEPVLGAGVIMRLDNIRRFFVGTPTKIYENVASAWVDVSKADGYLPGGDNRWRFAQFGNATLATNQMNKIQQSTGAGFADIPEAPQARIIETVAGFVMAFATVDPINGDEPDRWWASGLYNHEAWAPSQATQAANGRFIDSPGEIRAAKKLGQNMVVYKERSMYLGMYVGPPVVWSWQQVPGEIGALSQECVVSIDTAHLFIGNDDFWLFDGSRPVSIGAPVREWFFNEASPENRFKTQGYFDRTNSLVFWYFASKLGGGILDECLVYNTKTQKWGRISRQLSAVVEYVSPGMTFDNIGDDYPTFEDISDITYDSPRWFAQGSSPAIITPGGELRILDGGAMPSSVTLWDMGDDSTDTTITQVRPRFLKTPISGALQAMYKQVEGDALTLGPSATLWDGKFDMLWSARWHRLTLSFTGSTEFNAFDVKRVVDGTR